MTYAESAATVGKPVESAAVFRLIYRSHSRIPATGFEAELGSILRVARARNGESGITGALLVYDDWFAQTLEGDESAVRGIYLEKDLRGRMVAEVSAA